MGVNERNWIKEKVASGLDWKGIKNELRPDEEMLQSVCWSRFIDIVAER